MSLGVSNTIGGIKAVIKLLFPLYPSEAIIAGQQNNLTYPDEKFILITEFDSRQNGLIPIQEYDPISETQYYADADSTWMQADFYGADAKKICSALRVYLTGVDCNIFLNNEYSCTVHEVHEQKNLTNDLDRGKYKQRYMLKFSLFTNNEVSHSSRGFATIDPGVILADVQ